MTKTADADLGLLTLYVNCLLCPGICGQDGNSNSIGLFSRQFAVVWPPPLCNTSYVVLGLPDLDEEDGDIIEVFGTLLEEDDVLKEHGWYVSSYEPVMGGPRWLMWEKAELEGMRTDQKAMWYH